MRPRLYQRVAAAARECLYLPPPRRLPVTADTTVQVATTLTYQMGEMTRAMAKFLLVFGMVASVHQVSTTCKNCVTLGKEEKAMFRAHSDACLSSSKVDPPLVEAMCRGELADDPALRAHVYCVLLKCKLISKDGKLQKAAVLGKVAVRGDGKNVTKVLENCSDHQQGDTPEELAWNLFRCGYDKKAILFDYMPTSE